MMLDLKEKRGYLKKIQVWSTVWCYFLKILVKRVDVKKLITTEEDYFLYPTCTPFGVHGVHLYQNLKKLKNGHILTFYDL